MTTERVAGRHRPERDRFDEVEALLGATPAAAPDTAQPDTAQPDTAQPDTAQPDTAQPDTEQRETLPADNAGGAIGWGVSWRMHGLLLMAETTGDRRYVTRLARMIDAVIAVRDSARGVRDHRGLSLPVWSSAGQFTVATATVPSLDGTTALLVDVGPPQSAGATVTVSLVGDDRFDLEVSRPRAGALSRLRGLSLDPADPRRADRIAYALYDADNRVTVRMPSAASDEGGVPRPRPGRYGCTPARVALAAQTGMVAYPIVGLVRLARDRPDLVPPAVAARTDDYLTVVADAIAAHDEQWRVTAVGEGHYVWLPDEPVAFSGVELPTNEFLAMGRCLAQFAAVTGDLGITERAQAVARTLHNQLTGVNGALSWPYWPSFGRVFHGWSKTGDPATDGSHYRPEFAAVTRVEDVTHALIDLDFILLCATIPAVAQIFTEAHLRALARTFTRRVFTRRPAGRHVLRPTVRRDISGRGAPGDARHEAHVAGWLPLRQWDPTVARRVRVVDRHRRSTPVLGVDSYCAALLARWG